MPNDAIACVGCAVEAPTDDAPAMPSTTQGAPTVPIELPTKAFRVALY